MNKVELMATLTGAGISFPQKATISQLRSLWSNVGTEEFDAENIVECIEECAQTDVAGGSGVLELFKEIGNTSGSTVDRAISRSAALLAACGIAVSSFSLKQMISAPARSGARH